MTIPVAETGVVNRFSKTVGALLNRIEAAKTEIRSLAAQRDALLPSLVSGEVAITHIERWVSSNED